MGSETLDWAHETLWPGTGKRKEKGTLLRGKATERTPFSIVFSGQSVYLNAQESGIPLQHLGELSEHLQRAMVLSVV